MSQFVRALLYRKPLVEAQIRRLYDQPRKEPLHKCSQT